MTKKYPKVLKITHMYPKVPKSTKMYSKEHRSKGGQSGFFHRGDQTVAKNTQNYNKKKYQKVLKSTYK